MNWGLPPEAANLGVGVGSNVHQTATVMLRLEPLLDEVGTAAPIGDVNDGGASSTARVTL